MTITVLEPPHTKTKRREPLRTIDMATSQAQARPAPSAGTTGKGRGGRRTRLSASLEKNDENVQGGEKKRKADVYDEDVEGFQFSRGKKPKPAVNTIPEVLDPGTENPAPKSSPRRGRPPKKRVEEKVEDSTAKPAERASKRTTRGNTKAVLAETETQPQSTARPTRKTDEPEAGGEKKRRKGRPSKSKTEGQNGFGSPEPQPSEPARIALPLADTPVIQRNKQMRGAEKSGKKARRSSLGMRGRRASSLIDSGASNALPHKEVGTADFYKHISSDGLPEPRRMRQLLIWCATRAVGEKPSGAGAEDASAQLAARVIQEELLKDFSTNSELSNWFAREDVNPPTMVVKKPNPKNIQNADKIKELEEQIQRLQRERHTLNTLLRPPSIPQIKPRPSKSGGLSNGEQPPAQAESSSQASDSKIDSTLLDPSQQTILATIEPDATKHPDKEETLPLLTPSAVSSRLSRITTSLAPTLDSLAAGVHEIELYRTMGDMVSSRVLRICAERLDERDARNALRRLAIEGEDSKDQVVRVQRPREDLGAILGALSRVERR